MASRNGKSDKGGFKGKRSARGASVAGEKARSRQNRGQDVGSAGKEFDEKTGFKTSSGFLKDKYGNLVRSKRQVERFNEQKKREKALRDMFASQIQAQEAKQVTPTFSGLKGILDKTRKSLGTGEFSIEKANQLKDINRALGDFDYTGMSIGNQLRAQAGDLAAGIPGLARAAGFIANPLASIGTGLITGGKGIASLAGDILGGLKTRGQNVLSEFRDEDIVGYTDEGTPVRVGQSITETTDRPGFLSGIASALRFGEGPGFTEDRGGGRQQPIIPQPTGGFASKIPTGTPIKKAIPVTGQPVDDKILNQYLALAGFTPQEIQGMPETFRFLG